MPCCMVEEYKWCKDEPVVEYRDDEGRGYCIFHAPQGKKGVTLEEFNRKVFERVNFAQRKKITCYFFGTVFDGDISFSGFNKENPLPPIDFSVTWFGGKVNFTGARFGEIAFFCRAEFGERVDFSFAAFGGEATFNGAKFGSEASFSWTAFKKHANFGEAAFRGEADFSEAEFVGNADFSLARFRGEAYFSVAGFGGNADFSGAKFSGKAGFSGVEFSGETLFLGGTFEREAIFRNIRMKERVRFDGVNLKKVSFLDTDVRGMDFINCKWVTDRWKRRILYDEIKLFSVDREMTAWFEKTITKVEDLYRKLKQKYKEEHDEQWVSNWHYGEKEMYRKANRRRRYFPFLSLTNLYWLSSGYAERPVRAVLFLGSLIVGLSLLQAATGLVPSGAEAHGLNGISGLSDFFSKKIAVSLLTTLQYASFVKTPSFTPISWAGEYVKQATRIFVPLQAALFALAIRNRLRR